MRMKIAQWDVKKENQRGGPWEQRFILYQMEAITCKTIDRTWLRDNSTYIQSNWRITTNASLQWVFNRGN
jgi:hypothetical protein